MAAAVETVHVLVDAAIRAVGHLLHLGHPGQDLVAVVHAAFRDLEEERVHALHFVLDELHVSPDAAQQLHLPGKGTVGATQ